MLFNIETVFSWLRTSGKTPNEADRVLSIDLIEEEYEELLENDSNNNRQGILDDCIDLFWVIGNLLYFEGFTQEEIENHIEKVRAQNWSKFDKTEEDANKTVEMYGNGTHPNKLGSIIKTYWDKVGEYYIIKKVGDNKILKSHTYKED